MTLREWLSLWRFTKAIDVPAADVVLMCPYAFVRVLWYQTSKEYKAWPNTLDTGIVLGWRWPFQKQFREKSWVRHDPMPLAIFGGPMDEVYLARAVRELGIAFEPGERLAERNDIRHLGHTVKQIMQLEPRCDHNLWLASCSNCARKTLRLANHLKSRFEPVKLIDPHRDPVAAFRERQAEAEKRLGAQMKSVPELPEEAL